MNIMGNKVYNKPFAIWLLAIESSGLVGLNKIIDTLKKGVHEFGFLDVEICKENAS